MTFNNPVRPPATITSRFGIRVLQGNRHFHNGIDLVTSSDDILASHEGTCTFSGVDQYGGLFIDITNGNQMTRYLHNRQNLVKRGDVVKRGQLIAYMGNTGWSTGRHLHFETWVNGQRVNPESVVNFEEPPYTEPVKPEPQPPSETIYTVKPGDTLSEIVANHYGLTYWPDIQAKYEEVARINGIANPSLIYPNQQIKLP